MKNKIIILTSLIFLIFLFLSLIYPQTSQNISKDEWHPALRNAKVGLVIINEDYGKADKVSFYGEILRLSGKIFKNLLGIELITERKLGKEIPKECDVRVLESIKETDYDFIVEIEIKGEALGAQYIGILGGYHYSGATAEVTVYINSKTDKLTSYKETSTVSPPLSITSIYWTPNSAPFSSVVMPSYIKSLTKALYKSFGGTIFDILNILKDESETKVRAVFALGEIKDIRAIEPLILALGDEDSSVRYAAREALNKIDPKWNEREEVKKYIPEFINALEDKSWRTRVGAAFALGEIKDIRAIEPLILALSDENDSVRDEARDALKKIDPKWNEREEAKRAVPKLINVLKDKSISSGTRVGAAFALGEIKDISAFEPLVLALGDENRDVRNAARDALNKIDPKWYEREEVKKYIPEFINALKDKSWKVREGAAFALGEIKDIRAIEPLVLALLDESIGVRSIASDALNKIDPKWYEREEVKKLVPELINALKSKTEGVRIGAAYALGKIKDISAVDPLIQALKDKSLSVRIEAANALGELKDIRAITYLIPLLGDDYYSVRNAAREALKKITNQDFGFDQEKWLDWWEKNKISL
ncbi:MAG: HEAT repeat domain-containing protein [Candidatus Methanomethylicaceae archaeon]